MISLLSVRRNMKRLRSVASTWPPQERPHRHVSVWNPQLRSLRYSQQLPLPQPLLFVQPPPLPHHQQQQRSKRIRSFTSTKLIDPDRCNLNVLYRYAS